MKNVSIRTRLIIEETCFQEEAGHQAPNIFGHLVGKIKTISLAWRKESAARQAS